MSRFLAFFSVERSIGLYTAFAGVLLLLRPYAAGLMTLEEIYGIVISPSLFGALLVVNGLTLCLLRDTRRWVFALLTFPLLLYAICLLWTFTLGRNVGPLGFFYGVGFWGLSLYVYEARKRTHDGR